MQFYSCGVQLRTESGVWLANKPPRTLYLCIQQQEDEAGTRFTAYWAYNGYRCDLLLLLLLLLLLPFLWSACDMNCVPHPQHSVFTPLADRRPAVDGLENTFSCEYARRSRGGSCEIFERTRASSVTTSH